MCFNHLKSSPSLNILLSVNYHYGITFVRFLKNHLLVFLEQQILLLIDVEVQSCYKCEKNIKVTNISVCQMILLCFKTLSLCPKIVSEHEQSQ